MSAIAIGRNSTSGAVNAITLGVDTDATATNAVAISAQAQASGLNALAIGTSANASADNAIAMGAFAVADAADAVAIGTGSTATGGRAVAIGAGNFASGNGAVAIGDPNTATGNGAVAQGLDNTATGNGSVAMGNTNMVGGGGQAVGVAGTAAQGAVGIGYQNTVVGQGSVALGSSSGALAAGAVAFGDTAVANNARDVALGSGSVTAVAVATPSTTIDGVSYNFAGTNPTSTVSVGSLGAERTITNVAAGRISGSSTDAINGSQLFATHQSIENLSNQVEANATHYFSVNDGGVQGGNYNNDGATGANALAAGVNASATGNLAVAVGFSSSAADQGAVAVGVNSEATASWATAVGDTATASGQFATAVGNNAQAGDQFSTAFGANSAAAGRAATAVGPNAGASGASAVAVGDTARASGTSSAAFGRGANASALGALAMGPASTANARSATALGDSSAASGEYATALGAGSIASAPQGVALGSFSVANTAAGAVGYDPVTGLPSTDTSSTWVSRLGAVSVGGNGQTRQITNLAAGTTDTDAVNVAQLRMLSQAVTAGQTHYYSVNDGGVQGGNYANDGATGLNALAAGVDTAASGGGAVAIGAGATAADANSVALGSGSATAAAVATSSTTINGVTYNFAGTTPTGTLSVGTLGGERTITNVAAGRISDSSTDAINGSQLFATNQSIENLSNVVEASATHYYSVNDGGVQGGNYANDGATGLNALAAGVNATAAGAGSVAIGFGATAADANSVALGSSASTAVAVGTSSVVIGGTTYGFAGATPVGTVSVGSLGAERTITNLAAGRISGSSTDAINGSQLFATNQSIENLSNEVDASATHYYSVNDGGVQGGNHANDGATGLNALAAGVSAAAGGAGSVAIGYGATATDDDSVALGSNASTAAAVGTAGIVIGGTSYSFAGTAPVGTVSVGSLGSERTITNVAAGRVAGDSTDAINGSQLHATNQAIANLSNTVNASTAHYYSVNDGGTRGGNYNNDGASGVNSVAAGVNASASGQGGVAMGVNSVASGTGSVAVGAGSQSTVAGGVALGSGSVSNTAAGVTGYVPAGATSGQTAAIVATTSTAGAVSVGDASSGVYRQITGVAAGTAPSDAVNVAQLQAVQNQVNASATHYYSVNDGGVQGGNYANNGATGTNAMAGGVNASASGNNSVAMGANTSATANDSAALGAGSRATHVNSVAIGNGSATTVGAQTGYNAAYVGNSTSTGEMNIGGRTITGVAPGIAGTDAVNVNQLSSGVNYAINQANQYTDARLAQLDNDVWTMERGYRGATSSAMAMAGLPQAYLPGKSMLAVGFGGYQGEYGMAIGLSGITDNGRYVYKAQASGNTTRDWGFSVGAGIQW
ncbi:YadA-like family protein [Lysobacter sp. 5GHs7-4]|nr:YadA-like family protein [Lysobacter sp. 5GHs7-4]